MSRDQDWSWKPPEEEAPTGTLTPIQYARLKAKRFLKEKGCKKISNGSLGLARQLAGELSINGAFRNKSQSRQFLKAWAFGNVDIAREKMPRVGKKSFYASWAWKKLRFEVLKQYGPKCMCCGSDHRPTVDHIKPRARFPELELDFDNLQVLCNDCNMGKSNDDFTDFRPDRENILSPEEYAELEYISETRDLH